MGLLGRYIDALPAGARDRLIQAQEWCVAAVRGADGARCLVGHAEDWREVPAEEVAWRAWVDGGDFAAPDPWAGRSELDLLCRPELFAFRRARPGALGVYRARLARWGAASESRIGARFDRLCARRGVAGAVAMVKRRAARAFAVDVPARSARAPRPRVRGRRSSGGHRKSAAGVDASR